MNDLVASLIAKLAVSVLEALLARHDLKQSVREEISNDILRRIVQAQGWALAHPDPGGLHDAGGAAPIPDPDSFKSSK